MNKYRRVPVKRVIQRYKSVTDILISVTRRATLECATSSQRYIIHRISNLQAEDRDRGREKGGEGVCILSEKETRIRVAHTRVLIPMQFDTKYRHDVALRAVAL